MKLFNNETIFLSRDKNKATNFIKQFEQLGGRVIAAPLISFTQWKRDENKSIIEKIDQYDWIIFTSINGVHFFFKTCEEYGLSVDDLKKYSHIRYGAVGTKTEEALKQYSFSASFVPSVFDADHFSVQFLKQHHPNYPLLVKGNLARDVIDQTFNDRDIPFDTMYVYRTEMNNDLNLEEIYTQHEIDYYCFTSPSSIEAFIQLYKGVLQAELNKPCFCIGETTKSKAKQVGFSNIFIPNEYTLDGLANLIIECKERGQI